MQGGNCYCLYLLYLCCQGVPVLKPAIENIRWGYFKKFPLIYFAADGVDYW